MSGTKLGVYRVSVVFGRLSGESSAMGGVSGRISSQPGSVVKSQDSSGNVAVMSTSAPSTGTAVDIWHSKSAILRSTLDWTEPGEGFGLGDVSDDRSRTCSALSHDSLVQLLSLGLLALSVGHEQSRQSLLQSPQLGFL
jgi:hypothetical protein